MCEHLATETVALGIGSVLERATCAGTQSHKVREQDSVSQDRGGVSRVRGWALFSEGGIFQTT